MNIFNYKNAFSRNIGWLTESEQNILSHKKIAIPGMGGVGGYHLYNFLRLGIQNFHTADLDYFSLENFNRQIGASLSSIGKTKIDHMTSLAKDINPHVQIKSFDQGVQDNNIEEFLEGVDLIADGLDLYEMNIRIKLYDRAFSKGIPIITAGPFGMGTSVLAFHPAKMSFNEYFDLNKPNLTNEAKVIRFLVGVAPKMYHRTYVASPRDVKLFEGRLPSLHVGVLSATSVLGSIALKILLNRGDVLWAPKGIHVDFYRNKFNKFWCPRGNKNPFQRLKIRKAFKMFEVQEFG